MSLCTLPSSVSADVLGISPHINVVLFITETHILLCRRSGQQVWSSRLPHKNATPERVSNISWSPDGLYFALIYESGNYHIFDVGTGRPTTIAQHIVTKHAASVAWTVDDTQPHSRNSIYGILDSFSEIPSKAYITSSLAAVGTQDGKLCISLFGALDLDEIPLNTQSIDPVYLVDICEHIGEYAAIQNQTLYVYKNMQHNNSKDSNESLVDLLGSTNQKCESNRNKTHSIVMATLLAEHLLQTCNKIEHIVQTIQRINHTFIESFNSSPLDDKLEQIRSHLLRAVLFGIPSDTLREWMASQHEQGFKKWYKAASQQWDTLQKLITDDVLTSLAKLNVVCGQFTSEICPIKSLHELMFSALSDLVPLREMYENQAAYLEYLFREEIDRPIAVTKLGSVVLSDVALIFAGENSDDDTFNDNTGVIIGNPILGRLDTDIGTQARTLATEIQKQLQVIVEKVKIQTHNQLKLKFTLDLNCKAVRMKRIENTNEIAVLLESNQCIVIGDNGQVVRTTHFEGSSPTFIGNADQIISLDTQGRSLVLPNQSRVQLDFEPIAMVARNDKHGTTACVLSEDCQHYQFVELD